MLDLNLIIDELAAFKNLDYAFDYNPEYDILKFEKLDNTISIGLLGIDTYHIKNIWINLREKTYRVTGTLKPEDLTVEEHLILHTIFNKLNWFKD